MKLLLLILPIVLLLFAHRRGHTKHSANIVSTMVLAIMSAMLLISSVLAQLDPVSLAHVTDQSNLAAQIYNFRLLWIGAVPVAIAFAAFFHPHSQQKH